jgi:dTDP-4-dehydrorhamnose 3,5-epimerase
MDNQPQIIEGGFSVDERGQVTFFNNFTPSDSKRFYLVENFSLNTVRGFHGHLKEEKFAVVVSGAALFNIVVLNDAISPKKDSEIKRFILSSKKPAILCIPAGFAHGFKVLDVNTKIMFFSNLSLEESKNDDYRFAYDYWGKEIWEIRNF